MKHLLLALTLIIATSSLSAAFMEGGKNPPAVPEQNLQPILNDIDAFFKQKAEIASYHIGIKRQAGTTPLNKNQAIFATYKNPKAISKALAGGPLKEVQVYWTIPKSLNRQMFFKSIDEFFENKILSKYAQLSKGYKGGILPPFAQETIAEYPSTDGRTVVIYFLQPLKPMGADRVNKR